MDEFRRQLAIVGERIRDWVSDLTSRLGGAAREARSTASERRARSRSDEADPVSASSDARGLDSDAAIVVATGEDDVASVIGRIDIADSPEVILIVRRDARALRRASAWPHIAAHVRRRGIELGVVAPRSDVRAHAKVNGLKSARTPNGLRPTVEYVDVMGRRVEVPPVPWGRVVKGSMIVVALSTITFMACYRVPSATITIIPPSEPVSASGMARANALADDNDVATTTILATTVRRQVFTAVTTTTTGEVEVGDQRALLEVTFANDGPDIVGVPRLTRLVNDEGIVFTTDEDLDVPPGETATVSATAEFPGEPGNIAANSLVTIEGGLPASLRIDSSTAGSGGTNQLVPGVAQADVDRVRDIAGGILDQIAIGTLEQLVADEELGTLLPASVSAAIFSERPLQQLEQPSDIFVVEYTITASGLVVTSEDAARYGEQLIRGELGAGLALIPGSVTATVEAAGERGQVVVSATGRAATLANIAVAANQVTGMRPEAARNLLREELQLQEPPVIEISPNFVPWLWLPRRASSIEVIIGSPESASEDEDAEDGGDGGEEGAAGTDGDAGDADGQTEGDPTDTPTEAAAGG
ncbi:MAG: baseplate J/gp47 family protein [Dehalococcoidia bacterium]